MGREMVWYGTGSIARDVRGYAIGQELEGGSHACDTCE